MTYIAGEIHPEPAGAGREELLKSLELVPAHPGKRLNRHVLDPREDALEEIDVGLSARRDRETTIARQDRRHTMEAGHRRIGIERDLRIIVGMRIDDARRDY
jgi:hypothetical protein